MKQLLKRVLQVGSLLFPLKITIFILLKRFSGTPSRSGTAFDRHDSQRYVCGASFTIEHALNCRKGGFIHSRHDNIRNFTAELLSEVCKDVSIEPMLTPLTGETFKYKTTNEKEGARLDVAARGVWNEGSRAFFDVRVFNPTAQSYSNQTLKATHKTNENSKKREYAERVLKVEHGTFTPLVFSRLGALSVECAHLYNKLSDMISEKRNIATSKARTSVRTKLSFCLLPSAHICI